MRAVLLCTLLLAGIVVAGAPAQAGVIERACLESDRAQGNRSLCGCIQRAADRTLSGRDQRTAARFFRDPDRAQEVRMSDRRSDKAFWERYEAFGYYAELSCAG